MGETGALGYSTDQNGNIVLTMIREDFDLLVLAMGFGTVNIRPEFRQKMLGLVNRINSGNPNFTPYEIPPPCPDCERLRASAYSDAVTSGFFFTECERHRRQS